MIAADEAGPPGAPLIALVHGTMDRSTGMLKLSRRLDREFRVLRYDRRGYGRSVPDDGAHPGPFDIPSQVDDLLSLLAERRAVVVGHSYGGNVALAAALRRPDLIAGVAIYETPLSWEPWWPAGTAGAAARSTTGSSADAAEQFMRRLIGDDAWERLPERTRSTRRAEGDAMVGELRDLQANRPWVAEQITCPLVLGVGSHARPQHEMGMRFLHDLFPSSVLVELPGCRHDAPTSHSALFAENLVHTLIQAVGEPWAS